VQQPFAPFHQHDIES